ncbi:MAG TPA: ABC transporter permease [Dictyoglomaceae bacterium]|nr:ABC transporter permease [Dictyoglomaceae bacterium]HOL39448.1 ABC transporter permease [Dictyoglomaceae bacterium]HOP94754.1 ABC transporter permease [Dictyoglomaceae bacterium]HPP15411.1 ABC transporter permease [Dictyoglomaceae bacterium]HPU43842.1 ABC transporter permease [Dictyoglomaceae bacterium]
MFVEIVKMAIHSFSTDKLRTFLTTLGIIIGVAAVVTLMALGEGTKVSIEKQFTSLGSNLLTVFPRRGRNVGLVRGAPGSSLTNDDYDALVEEIDPNKVVAIVPYASRNVQVKYLANNTNTQVVGTSPEYLKVREMKVANGSFFTEEEYRDKTKVAVLGSSVAETLFGESDPIGQKIKIAGISFKVMGVLESQGQLGGFANLDDMVFIPLTTFQRKIQGGRYLNNIYISAVSSDVMNDLQTQIEEIIRRNHKITDPERDDFEVQNQLTILSSLNTSMQTLTLFLAGIAAISLLVGGIGIMNIMLVNVTERIKEIGIKKAIGAKSKYILFQFLIESIIVSVAGGLAGIVLGITLTQLIKALSGLSAVITMSPIVLAFSVSVLVGVFFGYYPAQRASKLNPIEALRYE